MVEAVVGGAGIQFRSKDGFLHFSTWLNGLTSFEHAFYGCNISLSALQARRLCGWDREGWKLCIVLLLLLMRTPDRGVPMYAFYKTQSVWIKDMGLPAFLILLGDA